MPDDNQEREERIRELERELAELKAEEPPLTIAQIEAMSAEELATNVDRVKRSLAGLGDAGRRRDEEPALTGPHRIGRAYADRAAAASAAREAAKGGEE